MKYLERLWDEPILWLYAFLIAIICSFLYVVVTTISF
jgi:hypothetical protein